MYKQNLTQLDRTERTRKYLKIGVIAGALVAVLGATAPDAVKTKIKDSVKAGIEYALPQTDDPATVCRMKNGNFYVDYFRGKKFGIHPSPPTLSEGGGINAQIHKVNYLMQGDENPISGDPLARLYDLYQIVNQNGKTVNRLGIEECTVLHAERANIIKSPPVDQLVPYYLKPKDKP